MDIQAEKLDLIQWLTGINDSNIIRQVSALRESTEKAASNKLSQAEKDAVDKGLQSLNEGRFKSHEDVMEITRKKYPHVVK
jgi:predicted transcriptional regulator